MSFQMKYDSKLVNQVWDKQEIRFLSETAFVIIFWGWIKTLKSGDHELFTNKTF